MPKSWNLKCRYLDTDSGMPHAIQNKGKKERKLCQTFFVSFKSMDIFLFSKFFFLFSICQNIGGDRFMCYFYKEPPDDEYIVLLFINSIIISLSNVNVIVKCIGLVGYVNLI